MVHKTAHLAVEAFVGCGTRKTYWFGRSRFHTGLNKNNITRRSIFQVVIRSHRLGHVLETVTNADSVIVLGRIPFVRM